MLSLEHCTLPQNVYSKAVLDRMLWLLSVTAPAFNLSIWEEEAGRLHLGLLWSTQSVPLQPKHTVRPCLKKEKKRKTRSPSPSVWDL